MTRSIAYWLFLSLVIGLPSFADENPASSKAADECHMCSAKHRYKGWAVELVPKAYFRKDNALATSFAVNGFAVPAKTQVGSDLRLYGMHENGWQGGLSFSGLEFRDEAAAAANPFTNFEDRYGGLWIAKHFEIASSFGVTVGSVFGLGVATLEVLGASQNNRLREFKFVVEPTVAINYQVCRWMRAGLTTSYLLPFLRSDDVKGTDVGVRNISTQGLTAGVQLAFGRFSFEGGSKE
jgi:hypothetical protein